MPLSYLVSLSRYDDVRRMPFCSAGEGETVSVSVKEEEEEEEEWDG